jgi:ABC-type lipoprotein export system ATPase subunit
VLTEVENLAFHYGGADGFSLNIAGFGLNEGQHTALIGPSGCGKTTLLHLLGGILVPAAGSITHQGTELSALSDASRRAFRIQHIGLVFQAFELLDYLNVLDNVLVPYRINPALKLDQAVRDRAARAIDAVGLAEKANRYVEALSQGERQRVAVARALVTQPALILADEPTGNLDPNNKERVLDLLLEVADATNATLLTVTHDYSLLPKFMAVVEFASLTGDVT